MYEKVKDYLISSGYKKYNTSTLLAVRNDMLFSISPQGVKHDITVWYSIFPLALPNLSINMGWRPAAGSFPKKDGKELQISYAQGNVEKQMIKEINEHIFPLFEQCATLENLEQLYSQGNFRSRYPQAFTLLAMQQYEQGLGTLREISDSLDKECWGLEEQEIIERYLAMLSTHDIEHALASERESNIRKHKLVNYMKKLL